MKEKSAPFSFLGFGLGLRTEYYKYFLDSKPAKVDWVEAITENFMTWTDGNLRRPIQNLRRVRENMPVVLHGVSMSLGSSDGPDEAYLKRLKALVNDIEPAWVSDHLCWTTVQKVNHHDLLPMPYTEEAIATVVRNIDRVQAVLKKHIVIENVSSYLEFDHSLMPEWEFLGEVARRSDCGILLDVNNVYVSSVNHSFDPMEYLQNVPVDRVFQFHLAGHQNCGNYLIDTHDHPVCDEVWDLYRWAARRFPHASTLIERDDHFPKFEVLLKELDDAREIWTEINGSTYTERAADSFQPSFA